jgi:hypothetical protein
VDPTEPASHVAFSSSQVDPELGMPSDGTRWAVIEGLGTDGQTTVRSIQNGLQQDFLVPPDRTVLELDYVFLYAEPPGPSSHRDAVIATVDDNGGAAPDVAVEGSSADPDSPYAGGSAVYATRDGARVFGTPLRTASLNLDDDFGDRDSDTRLTLTIRTANADDDRRSPLVYVDAVRFVAPVVEIAPKFTDLGGPYRVGDVIDVQNTTCGEDDAACLDETSWRWSFGSHGAMTTDPDATGSAEYSPSITYDERGTWLVELEARRADAVGTTDDEVEVLDPVVASFEIVQGEGPFEVPAVLDFTNTSDVDETETVAVDGYDWDFGGLSGSSDESPTGVRFERTGTYRIWLTITTTRGGTDTTYRDIVVE